MDHLLLVYRHVFSHEHDNLLVLYTIIRYVKGPFYGPAIRTLIFKTLQIKAELSEDE